MRPTLLLALAALLLATAGSAAAQKPCPTSGLPCDGAPLTVPDARLEVTGLAINAALGGLTAGIAAAVRGERFVDGFFVGAAGGVLVYGGKRLAVERAAGAGFAGRQVAAVGGSIVRNASRGDGAFSALTLPVGPLRIEIAAGMAPRVRLDLASAAVAGVFMVRDDARLDLGTSLSAGALVFRSDRGYNGSHGAGVILLRGDLGHYDAPAVLAHERVHVLQYDQAQLAWGGPAEAWVLGRSEAGRRLNRWLDLGLTAGIEGLLTLAIPYADRPWEREAYTLEDLAAPPRQGPVLLNLPTAGQGLQ